MTTTIASDDRRATSSVAAPGDGKRERNSAAPSRLVERNRIQPSTIRWKVTNQRSQPGAPNAAAERVLGDQPGAVERAPEHERPGRAVPEAAEQHRDQQVAVGEQAPAAAAAERDVDEVAQEARERHVPAAPEVAEAGRAVRAAEVLREDVTHQQREPDRHVGVAGEVAVDLRRVRVRGEQRRPALAYASGTAKTGSTTVAREVVGDDHLLDQPERDQRDARADRDLVRIPRLGQLRKELARAHDRPGHEVREEAEIDRDVDRARRLDQRAASRRPRTRSPGT